MIDNLLTNGRVVGVYSTVPPLSKISVNAIYFNGSSCIVTDEVQPYRQVSVETWFKSEDPNKIRQGIWFNGTGGDGFGLMCHNGGLSVLYQSIDWLFIPLGLDKNPHHCILTIDNEDLKFYYDGVLFWEKNHTSCNPPTGGFRAGAESIDGDNGFVGVIDGLIVYDNVVDLAFVKERYKITSEIIIDRSDRNKYYNICLSNWESRFGQQSTNGSFPYLTEEGYWLNNTDHYDPLGTFYKRKKYSESNKDHNSILDIDWTDQINAARIRYRDRAILETGEAPPAYNTYSHGLAIDWHVTNDPKNLEALNILIPEHPLGVNPDLDWARNWYNNIWWRDGSREVAFHLQGSIDRRWCGLPPSDFEDIEVQLCLDFVNHWIKSPEERYGVAYFPWITGLTARSLIHYWEYHLHSNDSKIKNFVDQIPQLLIKLSDVVWKWGWYPIGVNGIAEGGGDWTNGSIKYSIPDPDNPEYPNVPISTTIKVIDHYKFMVDPNLGFSDVEDFYKALAIIPSGPNDSILSVKSYKDKIITVVGLWGSPYTFKDGETITLRCYNPDDKKHHYASPQLNAIVSPLWAWAYWYTRVVLKQDGSIYRDRHDDLFTGQFICWGDPWGHKERHQVAFWGIDGLDYRKYGDNDEYYTSVYGTRYIPQDKITTVVRLENRNLLFIRK